MTVVSCPSLSKVHLQDLEEIESVAAAAVVDDVTAKTDAARQKAAQDAAEAAAKAEAQDAKKKARTRNPQPPSGAAPPREPKKGGAAEETAKDVAKGKGTSTLEGAVQA